MALFKMVINGVDVHVQCNQCGRRNMFQHDARVLTCNHCGNTFETEADVVPAIEQVLPISGNPEVIK